MLLRKHFAHCCIRSCFGFAVAIQSIALGQPPTANAHEQPPTANTHEQPPTANAHGQPPTANTHEQPPAANTHGQPPASNAEFPQRFDAALQNGEAMVVAETIVPAELSIVEAQWGASDGWVDVTKKLRDEVKNGRLSIPDLNVVLADVKDPKFGHDKAVVVVYQHCGATQMTIVASIAPAGRGGKLMLPETADVDDSKAFHEELVGTRWRNAPNLHAEIHSSEWVK